MDSHIGPKVGLCAEFQLDWFIGGCARECDGQPDGQTPGENSANYSPAQLVLGSELSNQLEICIKNRA